MSLTYAICLPLFSCNHHLFSPIKHCLSLPFHVAFVEMSVASEAHRQAFNMSAKDWVAAALATVGAKGGGRPNQAQGMVEGVDKIAEVKAEAEKYIAATGAK